MVGSRIVLSYVQNVTIGNDNVVYSPAGDAIGFAKEPMKGLYVNAVYSSVPGCGSVVIGYVNRVVDQLDFQPYSVKDIAPTIPDNRRDDFWRHYDVKSPARDIGILGLASAGSLGHYGYHDDPAGESNRVVSCSWPDDTDNTDNIGTESDYSNDTSSTSTSDSPSSGYSGDVHRSVFDPGGSVDVNNDGIADMGRYGGPTSRVSVDANDGTVRDYSGAVVGRYDPDSGNVTLNDSLASSGYVDSNGDFHANIYNSSSDKDDDDNGGWSLFGSSDDDKDNDDDDDRRKSWW